MKRKTLLLMLLMALFSSGVWAQTVYTSYTHIQGSSSSGQQNEASDKLVDNNKSTRWLILQQASYQANSAYCQFQSAAPITPVGYVITTGSDSGSFPGRNPKSWKIEASTDNSTWVTLQTITNGELPKQNKADKEFSFTNSNAYQYFKFTVTGVEASSPEGEWYVMQLNEFQFKVDESGGGIYFTEINNNTDWNNFARSVRNGLDYSGKTVNLNANISITSQANQAGSEGNLFKGTFDGHGNIITVNMTATGNSCAPFYGVENAAINNLIVTGNITSAYIRIGGISGAMEGNCTYTNCLSDVNITSTKNDGDVSCGGFNGHSGGSANPTFVGCAFTGSLTASQNNCGGFIGFHGSMGTYWAGDYNGRSTYTNCIFAPSSINVSANTRTAVFTAGYEQEGTHLQITVNNSYYNEEGAEMHLKQGTRAYTVKAVSPVTVAMSGSASTTYNVSGLNFYSAGLTLTTSNSTTIYAGNGNNLSLNLSGSNTGYQASAGSLSGSSNPYTLTMTNSNTVISAVTTPPASLPYTEDFENGQNGWEFGNGTQTNYWMVGSNTSYNSSNSLYITNDGSANAYNNYNSTSYVYAYRKLSIPSAGDYVVSFKWKANGESSYDLLRAFMIPASVNPTLTGGEANGQTYNTNTTPTGWIDVANPSGKLNLQTTWQSSDNVVNLSTAGEYYLVFFWKNDGTSGSTPPAAVDDIDIHKAATYNVTVSANGSGTVSGGGNNITGGTSVTVTATPNASNFINWTEDGTEVSTNPSYTFTLEGDRNLVANFEAWTVSIASEPASLVNLPFGTEVVLTASSNIRPQSLGEYTFSTGVDASKWYNVTSTTNIMDGTTSGDYAVSTVHTFGEEFTFPFAGTNYTQFSVNADGNLRLGGTVTGTSYYTTPFSSSNANYDNPKINGMGFDGYFDVSTYGNYVHAQIFGEAPNRVFVVEFKESPYSSSYRQYTWNWQVQLSEDGTIQIVYGDTAPGSYNYSNQIGLCVNASDGWTVSTTTHEATHFTNGTSTTNASATSWPGNNRYYRFSPVTYEWTYTGTAGTANGNVYTVTPTENSSYTVSVTHNGTTLTETVEVTMQALTKTIEAYTGERGGYYLIASPIGQVSPEDVTNMLSNDYDLYYFKQEGDAEGLEWINYESTNGDGGYDMMPGTGYLYANKQGTTLTFTGTPYNGNGEVTLSKKDCSNATGNFAGWNLVGNPFAQTAYFTNNFYTLNADRDEVVAGITKSVEAMEGIFVVAESDGETMTFSTTPLGKSNSQMSINVVRNRGNVIDRAIVRFDEESLLPKFQLNPSHTKIYIPQDGSDYAVVYADGAGTMPVNFKAEENGHYTLNFTTENVNFNYLHLIDNRNGNDVDLLQTPYYTFDAKSTDYASRFTLVFATGNDNDDTFAFFNNGVWIINNDGDATLQVVDALGRMLSSENISGSTSKAINVAPGVYMLRLINGDKVKVQKIVVKR